MSKKKRDLPKQAMQKEDTKNGNVTKKSHEIEPEEKAQQD